IVAAPGCRGVAPADPIERTDQACCAEADANLTHFKGCVVGKRNCSKKRKWWMRGDVTCGPIDTAQCADGRCCHYRQQYDPSIGETDPNWTPPGFPKPEPATDTEPAPVPDSTPEPEPEPKPVPTPDTAGPTVTVVLSVDGVPSIQGETLELQALRTRLCEVAKALPGVSLVIESGADTLFAKLLVVLDIAKDCGITRTAMEQTTD
ncbi:MAG: hypothetical protein JKY37_24555, partial [Nannocystaceae bacterium]|nr:hypothetical protein [Nannocystaceae bacterium]